MTSVYLMDYVVLRRNDNSKANELTRCYEFIIINCDDDFDVSETQLQNECTVLIIRYSLRRYEEGYRYVHLV